MGSSKRVCALAKRTLRWSSRFMAIGAATLLGRGDTAQAATIDQVDMPEVRAESFDHTMGYITVGDMDSKEVPPWQFN